MSYWRTFAICLALALAACGTITAQPLDAQRALACDGISDGYTTAAAAKTQGKLSAASIKTLTDLEPLVIKLCDPSVPATADALTLLSQYAEQVTLANAGVK